MRMKKAKNYGTEIIIKNNSVPRHAGGDGVSISVYLSPPLRAKPVLQPVLGKGLKPGESVTLTLDEGWAIAIIETPEKDD